MGDQPTCHFCVSDRFPPAGGSYLPTSYGWEYKLRRNLCSQAFLYTCTEYRNRLIANLLSITLSVCLCLSSVFLSDIWLHKAHKFILHSINFCTMMYPHFLKDFTWSAAMVCLCLTHLLSQQHAACTSALDLLRQLYVLPHWDRSWRSSLLSHLVTVSWNGSVSLSTDAIVPGAWQCRQ